MNLEYREGLLFSNIAITHHGRTIQFPNVIIDTGTAESILSIDVAQEMFNAYEPLIPGRFIVDLNRLQIYPATSD